MSQQLLVVPKVTELPAGNWPSGPGDTFCVPEPKVDEPVLLTKV